MSEFSRPRRLDGIGTAPTALHVAAEPGERIALARRFGLIAIDRLEADLTLVRDGDVVTLTGEVRAALVQACVASGESVPATIDEPLLLRFLPAEMVAAHDELELGVADLDVDTHDGNVIDVGEAVAATLALALDPFPRATGAADTLKAAGVLAEGEAGPFSGLAALRDRLSRPDRTDPD